MTTLGVSCTSAHAYLAVADGDRVVLVGPERLGFRAGLSSEDQLVEFAKDAGRALRDSGATSVVLLQAVANFQERHTFWTDRLSMETLIRLEAVAAALPCRYLSQQAVRGAFGITGRGGLAQLAKGELESVGRYWGEGRLLAALAAVTGERRG